jgi:FkbM family methyltransferase
MTALPLHQPRTTANAEQSQEKGKSREALTGRKVNNFTVLESVYGKFVVNRHCAYQAEALVKTGHTHIEGELKNMMSIIKTMPEKCVIVDAGANIGFVCVPIAQEVMARGGTVHAFEVQRMMYYALCGSAALNDLENLHIHNKAVGAASCKLKAGILDYSVNQDFGLFSLVDQKNPAASEDIEVTTIDALALPRLDFFKIDVEGMEIDVLKGAQNTLRRHMPWCWVEYWKVDINDIKRQFEGLDYKFFIVDNLNMLCAPVVRLKNSQIKIAVQEI